MRFLPLRFAALALAASPIPAAACSPTPGYAVPTNIELVEQADMILLATVTGGADIDAGDSDEAMRIHIKPVAALKGDLAAAPTTLPIALAPERLAIPSNPYDLQNAHQLSEIGGCIRYMVPKGSRLLFFLSRNDSRWLPFGGPFSRWAEDVLTDDAPWLQAVRFYVEVAALPEGERAAALAARRAEWTAKEGDFVAQLLAADVARQLAGPNKPLRGEFLPPDETDARSTADEATAAVKAATAAARATSDGAGVPPQPRAER